MKSKHLFLSPLLVLLFACQESAAPSATVGGAASAPEPESGEVIYNRFCFSCHAAGIAGAPKTGSPEAWAERLTKGRAALLQSTIDGIMPGMPPMGLCAQCSEAELQAAIDYMLPGGGGS